MHAIELTLALHPHPNFVANHARLGLRHARVSDRVIAFTQMMRRQMGRPQQYSQMGPQSTMNEIGMTRI